MSENKKRDKEIKNLDFIKEVAKYFMDFLETDFKRTRIPKRNTISKVNKDLKIAIDLEKDSKIVNNLTYVITYVTTYVITIIKNIDPRPPLLGEGIKKFK